MRFAMLAWPFFEGETMARQIPREVSDEFIRTAFERCPSGLIVVDGAGAITAVNQEVERLFGYSRDELLGQSVESLVPEHFVHGHAKLRGQYAQAPTARRMGAGRELSARHKDGSEIPVEIGLSPIDTPEGVFFLGTIVDVSERRGLEERLRQTHKLEAIGNLASGIAHDFNNILLGIIGYTELAREAITNLPSVVADLDIVVDTARRGRDLVNRILFFTRKSQPSRAPTSIETPVREAIQLLRATLPLNIEIREGFDASTPPVVADSNELHQVAMNLATNAAHAMKEHGGVLEIRVGPVTVDEAFAAAHPGTRAGLHVRLRVSDTGSGIPDKTLERIFEPFFTTKPQGEGTGLGLSVIKQIVLSLGGAVDVASRVGQGTSFDVYLPAAPVTAQRTEQTDSTHSHQHRILFVEDEERLAALGRRVLESAGFEVTTHTSSLQALEEFRSNPNQFDLLITDNTMPHMTGLELVAKVLAARPEIPVLMVSGIGESMSVEALKKCGVTRLLSKPYQSTDLQAAARELVAGSRA
jgi:PAS domain S-box-containing protein